MLGVIIKMNANPLTQNLSGFGFPSENSINKDLTATQQVASPKCPSDTSLNPNIMCPFADGSQINKFTPSSLK